MLSNQFIYNRMVFNELIEKKRVARRKESTMVDDCDIRIM